ncbi:MAG TPA: LytTR family DNA-binding domain-containing protein [Candidatus Bariatricus faecipullorum]|nr:LytTR family DNA-binding domain-containing protein [Candidatus Bariatricus faecipullorum]
MKIAVVDDDQRMRERLPGFLGRIPGVGEVRCFGSGEAFLDALKLEEKPDVVLADIEMEEKEMDGIRLGQIIRKTCPEIRLIYLTAHPEYAMESYTLDAYQYVLKDQMEERLPRILGKIARKLEEEEQQYRITGNSSHQEKVYYRDILVISKEKAGKYVQFVTKNQTYRERTSLEAVIRKLDESRFIQAERGILVNVEHIQKLDGAEICLDDGERIKISRIRLNRVKQQMNLYWRREE